MTVVWSEELIHAGQMAVVINTTIYGNQHATKAPMITPVMLIAHQIHKQSKLVNALAKRFLENFLCVLHPK